MLNSFQAVIILMAISRVDNSLDAGIFVIAYAVANLFIMIGRYGIRQYQVSDIKEVFSYKTYFIHRICTTIMMILVSVVYVAFFYLRGEYSGSKSVVIILICAVKAVDAFEDVIHGMFQQHKRLDIGGKILAFRLFIYIVEYMVIYYISQKLVLTSLICLITMIALVCVLDGSALKDLHYVKGVCRVEDLKRLTVECFPIFVSTFLMAYVANAPKYSIDIVLSSYEQAQFNYIFMPVFVISLLSTFIYQPMINRMAVIWNKNRFSEFWKLIVRQVSIILGVTVLAMLSGYFLGIPVLSVFYATNLSSYRSALVTLLFGGGMLALVNFFTMVITVTRYQRHLIWGYVIVSILFFVKGRSIAAEYGVMGISCFYTIAMFLLAAIFFLYIVVIARISKKKTVVF